MPLCVETTVVEKCHMHRFVFCYRWYWVADMKWTSDDLFLVCVTKQGALAILSRLGEPLLVQTHGNSIEMGPKLFLPLHPLIVVQ